ncbi:MAG: TIR domain-containing protein [Actinophytocola sp.]|uniref:TIR domain-containing protein n=1 Tax=Actinophytocola sp. TaxID=1872138 RepID=UPI003D6B5603
MSGYQFDVFISYIRSGNPHAWMRNHFLSRLRNCLADHLADEPAVFIDEEMDRGTSWPHQLEQALNRTKVMLAVFSPQYFRSPWCLAEWKTMVERERLLGLYSAEQPQGLIYPVLYSDSENFPDYVRDRAWRDLKRWNNPDPAFQLTPRFVGFHEQVEDIAIDLAKLLPRVPDWRPGWPAFRPDPPFRRPPPLPGF